MKLRTLVVCVILLSVSGGPRLADGGFTWEMGWIIQQIRESIPLSPPPPAKPTPKR